MHWTWSWEMIWSGWRRLGNIIEVFLPMADIFCFLDIESHSLHYVNSWFTMINLRHDECRNHRGLRHYWGLRVRGQHTKTTGRRGKTVGVSKKRWAFACFYSRVCVWANQVLWPFSWTFELYFLFGTFVWDVVFLF